MPNVVAVQVLKTRQESFDPPPKHKTSLFTEQGVLAMRLPFPLERLVAFDSAHLLVCLVCLGMAPTLGRNDPRLDTSVRSYLV